jgi:hypothetical protein
MTAPAHRFGLQMVHLVAGGDSGTGILVRRWQPILVKSGIVPRQPGGTNPLALPARSGVSYLQINPAPEFPDGTFRLLGGCGMEYRGKHYTVVQGIERSIGNDGINVRVFAVAPPSAA